MANGASRLFNVMKQTSQDTNIKPSQVVSLTVKSVQPLIFIRDDKLEITEDFCIIGKLAKYQGFRVDDIVTATVFNEGQQYYIEQNDSSNLDIVSEEELERIIDERLAYYLLKSGGQVTGLIDNIENNFNGFRKRRTIDGEEYIVDFGLGNINNTGTGAIQVKDSNGNILAGLDIKGSDGRIINTKTQKNLLEDNQKILWQGGAFMNENQVADLSEKVSEQNIGIVLVFSAYSDGEAHDYGWYEYFIPKKIVELHSGAGHDILIPDNSATYGIRAAKYLYVSDTQIRGNQGNVGTHGNLNNSSVVLRYVIGV